MGSDALMANIGLYAGGWHSVESIYGRIEPRIAMMLRARHVIPATTCGLYEPLEGIASSLRHTRPSEDCRCRSFRIVAAKILYRSNRFRLLYRGLASVVVVKIGRAELFESILVFPGDDLCWCWMMSLTSLRAKL